MWRETSSMTWNFRSVLSAVLDFTTSLKNRWGLSTTTSTRTRTKKMISRKWVIQSTATINSLRIASNASLMTLSRQKKKRTNSFTTKKLHKKRRKRMNKKKKTSRKRKSTPSSMPTSFCPCIKPHTVWLRLLCSNFCSLVPSMCAFFTKTWPSAVNKCSTWLPWWCRLSEFCPTFVKVWAVRVRSL